MRDDIDLSKLFRLRTRREGCRGTLASLAETATDLRTERDEVDRVARRDLKSQYLDMTSADLLATLELDLAAEDAAARGRYAPSRLRTSVDGLRRVVQIDGLLRDLERERIQVTADMKPLAELVTRLERHAAGGHPRPEVDHG